MNIQIIQDRCTGCRACIQLCPVHCISMQENHEGFLFPVVDQEACIDCGICLTKCPAYNDHPLRQDPDLAVYAAVHQNPEILMASSSGGAFAALAQYAFSRDGVVYGCSLNNQIIPMHIRIDQAKDLPKLHGSKYVQSDTGNTYSSVKKDLQASKTVLYSGTPCQIAGLKAYLGADDPNLITVDIICHGVPGSGIFRKHIAWLSKKKGAEIQQFGFRNKEKLGWGPLIYLVTTTTKTTILPYFYDVYCQKLFGDSEGLRECCYQCKYANIDREGDFTIGDYWGIQKYHPEIPTAWGVSLLIANDDKAKAIVNDLHRSLTLYPSRIEWARTNNRLLNKPVERPTERDTVFAEIEKLGYDCWAEKYYRSGYYIKALIKSKIPRSLKTTIKQIIRRNKEG